jgi:hypothetical protein
MVAVCKDVISMQTGKFINASTDSNAEWSESSAWHVNAWSETSVFSAMRLQGIALMSMQPSNA